MISPRGLTVVVRSILGCALLGGAMLIAGVLLQQRGVAHAGLMVLLATPIVRSAALALVVQQTAPRVLALTVGALLLAMVAWASLSTTTLR